MSLSKTKQKEFTVGNYRPLGLYNGVLPGEVGTVQDAEGNTRSIPVPAFAPNPEYQTVPRYHVEWIGKPDALTHGLDAEQLSGGYFPVKYAYSDKCTTFVKSQCGESQK